MSCSLRGWGGALDAVVGRDVRRGPLVVILKGARGRGHFDNAKTEKN